MYCAALSTGICFLANYFSRPVAAPKPILSAASSISSINDLSKPKLLDANVVSGVEVYRHDFETFGKATLKSTTSSVRRSAPVAKPVVVVSNVTCRGMSTLLETRNKVPVPVQVINPILTRKSAEEAELEELVENVRQMEQDLEAFKHEVNASTRLSALVREISTEDIDENVVVREIEKTESIQHSSVQPSWIDATETFRFAMRVVHCEDMTDEGVDEVLYQIFSRMSVLVFERAENTEEQKQFMDEAVYKIKEYAEVLLATPREVELAVERVCVRIADSYYAEEVEYLAPLSQSTPTCDLLCVGSHLPHGGLGYGYQ
ncbi:hypothetical protein FRC07_007703, partial [Ceratobasidium sp. 392]